MPYSKTYGEWYFKKAHLISARDTVHDWQWSWQAQNRGLGPGFHEADKRPFIAAAQVMAKSLSAGRSVLAQAVAPE